MTVPERATPVDRYHGLTPAQRAHIQEIKARNGMIVAIAGESWGNKLTEIQQRAFAEYMRRFRLDISEVNNLGGRPYRNGNYYQRRIAELAAEGRVEWYKGEHIGPDERLDVMAKEGDEWAKTELTRRVRERILLGVPPDAEYAYVVRVKMHELGEPTVGMKFIVLGRQKEGWSKTQKGVREMVDADPVGDENPIETVETRAWRRVGKIVAAEIPELRANEELMEAAADETQEAVLKEALAAEERDQRATITPKPLTTDGEDPYRTDDVKVHQIGAGPAQPVPVASQGTDRISRTPEPEPEHIEREYSFEDNAPPEG